MFLLKTLKFTNLQNFGLHFQFLIEYIYTNFPNSIYLSKKNPNSMLNYICFIFLYLITI